MAAKRKKAKKGMGFKAAQSSIARRQGVSKERAGAILAASTRRASPAAKRRNPNLKKVKGKAKGRRRR
jgi:hypothetical protein